MYVYIYIYIYTLTHTHYLFKTFISVFCLKVVVLITIMVVLSYVFQKIRKMLCVPVELGLSYIVTEKLANQVNC